MQEPLKTLSEISSLICSNIIKRDGIFSADIFLYWQDIVGGYAKYATPLKITKVNHGHNLFISTTNECSVLDLQYSTEIIKSKINTFFGKDVIQFIKIHKKY